MSSDVVLTCGRLRMIFRRLSDRIGHRVEVLNADTWSPLLDSVEGSATDDWPSSPPLQTLHVEERPEGPVALLVGMAGRSHWSASVAADVTRGRIAFDLACRTPSAPGWLGSTYRWLVDDENSLRQQLQLVPAAATVVSATESQMILKAELDPSSAQRTFRWGYTIDTSSP